MPSRAAQPVEDELPPYLTIEEAAPIARRTPNAMRKLRLRGKGPRVRKIDGRLVIKRTDLLAWLEGETAPTPRRHKTA
jgi:hypothetical protein